MRAAVYVDDGGILLCRVEVGRLYQAVVQVCLAVCGFDGAYFYAGHFKAFVGVLGCQQCVFPLFLRVGGHQFYDTGASGRRGIVDEVSSHEAGDLCRVHAGWVSYQAAFAILQVDSVKVALQRRDFRTLDNELFRVPVKPVKEERKEEAKEERKETKREFKSEPKKEPKREPKKEVRRTEAPKEEVKPQHEERKVVERTEEEEITAVKADAEKFLNGVFKAMELEVEIKMEDKNAHILT